MSGPKGVYAEIAALVVGVLAGVVMALLVTQMAQLKTTQELYLSDLSSIDMLYKSRNMQEYLRVDEDEIVGEFVESGGPRDCGTVSFDNSTVSAWKSPGCELSYSPALALSSSGFIAAREAERYETYWGVSVSQEWEEFCMEINDDFQFGVYNSRVCFDSPLDAAVDAALKDMDSAYRGGGADCSCFDSYSVCWTEVGDWNFTYALIENC
jgi:hypothetical protein